MKEKDRRRSFSSKSMISWETQAKYLSHTPRRCVLFGRQKVVSAVLRRQSLQLRSIHVSERTVRKSWSIWTLIPFRFSCNDFFLVSFASAFFRFYVTVPRNHDIDDVLHRDRPMRRRGPRAQSQNRRVVAQAGVVDEAVGDDPVDDRVDGGVGGRADQNARLHELLLHLDSRLVQSVDGGEEVVLAGEEHIVHESAERLVVEIELLVLQHVQQRQQRARLSGPRRSLDQREVRHGMISARKRHRSIQRRFHREQLASIELLAEVGDEGGRTARPRHLLRQRRAGRDVREEARRGVARHVAQNRRVFAGVDAAIEAWSRRHDFQKERVDGETERREFGRINGLEEVVIHAAANQLLARVRARLREEAFQKAVGASGRVSAQRLGRNHLFFGQWPLPAQRSRVVRGVDAVMEEEERRPLANGGAELRQRVDGANAGDQRREKTHMGVLRSSSVKSWGKRVVSWKTSACSLMGAAAEPDCVFMMPKKKGRWKVGFPASKENSTESSVCGVVGR